jgi:hypothetical protein
MNNDKLYAPEKLFDMATQHFPVELDKLFEHPDKIDDGMYSKLDDLQSSTSMFKNDLNESAIGLGYLMQLADMPDKERLSSCEDEDFLVMTRRLGILVEMIGRLSAKCDQIKFKAEFAMNQNRQFRKGEIVKGSDGIFVGKG